MGSWVKGGSRGRGAWWSPSCPAPAAGCPPCAPTAGARTPARGHQCRQGWVEDRGVHRGTYPGPFSWGQRELVCGDPGGRGSAIANVALALLSSLLHAEPKEPGEVGAGGLGAPLHAQGCPCQQTVPPRPGLSPSPSLLGAGAGPVYTLAAEEPQETDLLRGAAEGDRRLRGWALTRQQLRALFIKRLLHARRSTRGFFAQVRPVGAAPTGREGVEQAVTPPSRPHRSSCPLSSSASRCSSASSCRPSGSTRRCASSPGCTGTSSPSSGENPVPTPRPPPRQATISHLCPLQR